MYSTLISTKNLGQSCPGSYDSEGVLYTPQSFKTGTVLSDAI